MVFQPFPFISFSFKDNNQDLYNVLTRQNYTRFSIFHFETFKELFHILRSILKILITLTPCTFTHTFISKFKNNHFLVSRTIPLSLLANIISSTYKETMIKFLSDRLIYTKRSFSSIMNPSEIIDLWNLEYHCLND